MNESARWPKGGLCLVNLRFRGVDLRLGRSAVAREVLLAQLHPVLHILHIALLPPAVATSTLEQVNTMGAGFGYLFRLFAVLLPTSVPFNVRPRFTT